MNINAGSPPQANTNTAPYPVDLAVLVEALVYKPGWEFRLDGVDRGQGSEGLTLCILIETPDSYNVDRLRMVMHYMPVPPASFDQRSWQRWLLEQILLVERHEACEFFTLVTKGDFVLRDGSHATEIRNKPYAPSHGPGNDPYIIREIGTELDVKTSFRGEVNE